MEYLEGAYEGVREQSASLVSKVLRFALWGVVFLLVWTIVILIATILYSIFYWLIVPDTFFETPVSLDYGTGEEYPYVVSRMDRSVSQCNTSDLVADLYPLKSPLLSGYTYDVYVDFRVPDTVRNRDGGMIVWRLSLFNQYEQMLYQTTRSFIKPYVMKWVRFIRNYFMMIPILLDMRDQSQTHSVVLLENFIEHSVHRVSVYKLELYGDHLHTDQVVLRFMVKLTGMRWLVYNWFFTSAVFGIFQIALFIIIFLCVAYLYVFGLQSGFVEDMDEEPFDVLDDISEDSELSKHDDDDDDDLIAPFEKDEKSPENMNGDGLRYRGVHEDDEKED